MICPECIHADDCELYKKEKLKEELDIRDSDRGIFFGCDGFVRKGD